MCVLCVWRFVWELLGDILSEIIVDTVDTVNRVLYLPSVVWVSFEWCHVGVNSGM